ncbi:hypothetical protein B7494_g1680 [Chlorociboria aeruginascens]|nr:hypothetical protein B7494_g1680 [Chlorociboria aeruginascens]
MFGPGVAIGHVPLDSDFNFNSAGCRYGFESPSETDSETESIVYMLEEESDTASEQSDNDAPTSAAYIISDFPLLSQVLTKFNVCNASTTEAETCAVLMEQIDPAASCRESLLKSEQERIIPSLQLATERCRISATNFAFFKRRTS